MFFDSSFSFWFLSCIAVAAILYSSVGHGGASGYLAVMALFGLDPALMKPAALIMNIFVTLLILSRLSRAGHFNWRLFIPFIIGSIPFFFTDVPPHYRFKLLGAHVLSAAQFRNDYETAFGC